MSSIESCFYTMSPFVLSIVASSITRLPHVYHVTTGFNFYNRLVRLQANVKCSKAVHSQKKSSGHISLPKKLKRYSSVHTVLQTNPEEEERGMVALAQSCHKLMQRGKERFCGAFLSSTNLLKLKKLRNVIY